MARPGLTHGFGWSGIFRLGLVQASIGSIVVLTTSTLNRVMVVELALPAALPGLLVALHYFVQLLRPRLGYGSDVGRRRTPWIVGGMAVLALGGIGAALATAWMATQPLAGIAAAVIAFTLIGIGVGAAGTSMLVLLATGTPHGRRGAAASITWVMMIAGFVVTTATAGAFLDPFSTGRLVWVTAAVSLIAFCIATVAVQGLEQRGTVADASPPAPADALAPATPFRVALRQVWMEPGSRHLATFVFVSMLAFSAQDLVLEPFAGTVFGYTPGESTRLAGLQHSGVLIGMIVVALLTTRRVGEREPSLRAWTVGGCVGSALVLVALALSAGFAGDWPLRATVFALGLANGAYAVAAIGTMMGRVSAGRHGREGVRMGLWGAAQAVAFGLGGLAGTLVVDLVRIVSGSPAMAYASVFTLEAALFIFAAVLAAGPGFRQRDLVVAPGSSPMAAGEGR
jgi:BCD family chlorophyll transporter-like MFS transporter